MFINTTQQQYQITLDGDDTVMALKQKIAQECGVPERYQKLRFNNKTIHNPRLLSSYGIDVQNSEIALEYTLQGGCGCECCGCGCKCTIL